MDVFGEKNFIGQATYPVIITRKSVTSLIKKKQFFVFVMQVTCLRTGYRSICLRNRYSEDLELASLLIHLSIERTGRRSNNSNGDSELFNRVISSNNNNNKNSG